MVLLILAFFQVVFLPGYLILKCIGKKMDMIETAVFSFGLSLPANYVMVVLLLALHIFIQPVVLGIFAVEIVGILFFVCRRRDFFELQSSRAVLADYTANREKVYPMIYRVLGYCAAAFALVWGLMLFMNTVGTIFFETDAVGSYNIWAEQISQGDMPRSGYYPLMIPANWALTYVFSGTLLQFAAKAMMPLFFCGILLLLLNLHLHEKHFGYLLAIPIVTLVVYGMAAFYIQEGVMDFAVAFYTLLAIYCIYRVAEKAQVSGGSVYVMIAETAAVSAGLTKQAGLYIALILPIVCLLTGLKRQIHKRHIYYYLGMLFALVGTFYLYRFITIRFGQDASNVNWLVQDMHDGRNLFQRLRFSIDLLYATWNIVLIPLCIVSMFSLFDAFYRKIYLSVFVPYTVIWICCFSYDLRNWTLGMVFWGVSIAVGFHVIMKWLSKYAIFRQGWLINSLAAVIIICAFIFIGVKIPQSKLEERQDEQLKTICQPALNSEMYRYFDETPIGGKILSQFSHIKYLPVLGEYYQAFRANFNSDTDLEYDWYVECMGREDISYIVCWDFTADGYPYESRIVRNMRERIESGEFEVIWNDGKILFLHIIK